MCGRFYLIANDTEQHIMLKQISTWVNNPLSCFMARLPVSYNNYMKRGLEDNDLILKNSPL